MNYWNTYQKQLWEKHHSSLHRCLGSKQEVRAQGCGLKTAGIVGNHGVAISSTKYSWRQARVNTETNTVQQLHAGTQCTLPKSEMLIQHRVHLPSKGTWMGGRNGLRGTSSYSRKGVRSPEPVTEQPQPGVVGTTVQLGSTWRSWWAIISKALWQNVQQCPVLQWGADCQQGQGGGPSSPLSIKSPVLACPGQWSWIYNGFTKIIPEQAKAILKGPEHLSHTERLRELRLFRWRKRKLRGILSIAINTWTDSCQQMRKL